MPDDIQAIFFDIGDTLAVRVPDPPFQAEARREFAERLGTGETPDVLLQRLNANYARYVMWRERTQVEVPALVLWNEWLLPGVSVAATSASAEALTVMWRSCFGRRLFRPGAVELVRKLARGYVLGIISNTLSAIETPDLLRAHDVTSAFATVLLSAAVGIRKPCPDIFLQAAREAGVLPGRSAYVGDRPSRDVAGPRAAGYRLTCLMDDESSIYHEPADPMQRPDIVIHALDELYDVFPLANSRIRSTI